MCVTNSDGTPIWKRGGRVKDLGQLLDQNDTPSGALRTAAKNLRDAAELHQQAADKALQWANEKRAQALELEYAADKIDSE